MSEHHPYNSPEDEQMRIRILHKLQHDPAIDASKIQVEVRDAVAILKGKSDTATEKQLSEKHAGSVEGINSVENHLVIEVGIAHALSNLAAHIQGDIIKDDEDIK